MSGDESRVSAEILGDVVTDDHVITLVLSTEEHRMILAALDQKIWSLNQSGTSGAYKNVPAYRLLRDQVADVQPRTSRSLSETGDVTQHVSLA